MTAQGRPYLPHFSYRVKPCQKALFLANSNKNTLLIQRIIITLNSESRALIINSSPLQNTRPSLLKELINYFLIIFF